MIDPLALAQDSLIEKDFLMELKANGLSNNTLENYRKAVNTLSFLEESPENLTKQDLMDWSVHLQEEYSEGSQSLYKTCVKRYFKWLKTGDLNGGEYPECVGWMKVSSNRKSLPKEILSHKEIKTLASVTDKQRDRAMIWVGYESGCRPGELLTMKIRDLDFDRYGAQIVVDGKTGERRIRLIESVPDLRDWLSMHPDKDDPNAFLWISRRNGHLVNQAWNLMLRKYAESAGIKKHVYPHLLRHSRATHLAAKGLNEAQMREIFGWTKSSNMPSVYVHLSGRDTDGAILKLYGMDEDLKVGENSFEKSIKKCSFCGHENSPNARFCCECNAPLDSMAAESSDKEVREQDRITKKVVQKLIDKAPEVLDEILREEEISQEIQRFGGSKAKA